eukprot:6402466-Prymnesium_polylepis.1
MAAAATVRSAGVKAVASNLERDITDSNISAMEWMPTSRCHLRRSCRSLSLTWTVAPMEATWRRLGSISTSTARVLCGPPLAMTSPRRSPTSTERTGARRAARLPTIRQIHST